MAPFRVLIAGGSISGLTMAASLEKAGIDFLVLEGGSSIAPQLGASIGFHPHGANILDQLGAWKGVSENASPLDTTYHFDQAGKCFFIEPLQQQISKSLGYPVVFIERKRAIQALYDTIKHKTKILTGKSVKSYEEHPDMIVITTQDGSTYEGDILVGADGVHSSVRRLMSLAVRKDKGDVLDEALDDIAERAFISDYSTVFGISRRTDSLLTLSEGQLVTGYGEHVSSFMVAGVPGYVYWFLFVKNEKQGLKSKIPRYGEEDCDALIKKHHSHRMSDNITIGNIWDARVKAGIVAIEEGTIDTWSHGRVVLVGDAVHKMTINLGLGGNVALEGVTHLVNQLKAALGPTASSDNLSKDSIDHAFKEYRRLHQGRATLTASASGNITRTEAQDTKLLKFVSRYIVPLIPLWFKKSLYCFYARSAPILEFLPCKLDAAINSKRVA